MVVILLTICGVSIKHRMRKNQCAEILNVNGEIAWDQTRCEQDIHDSIFICNRESHHQHTPSPQQIQETDTDGQYLLEWICRYFIGSAVGMVSLTCIIFLMCYCYKRRQDSKKIEIKNPLVISIGIGIYDKSPISPEIQRTLRDLEPIAIDIANSIQVFNEALGYELYPNYDDQDEDSYKLTWQQDELIQFLQNKAGDLENNLRDVNEDLVKYDGLIVLISSHGIGHYIITSDWQKISTTAIHRIFSANKPMSRRIPRIFVFDWYLNINIIISRLVVVKQYLTHLV